jgi:shikimate 5-dehydrogenase
VDIELRGFNDRRLNRDLDTVCRLLAQAGPPLPDGRRLLTGAGGMAYAASEKRQQFVA